jgi:predicted alpha-1,2-mannosidase
MKKSRLLSTSRRSFLKTSSLAVAASVLETARAEPQASHAAPNPTERLSTGPQSLVSLVNIMQGTDSTPAFSRGNTLPIAARPFGMSHWTLQSNASTPWMFAPGQRRIQGFRCTHQLSPWLGDYGHAVFLPFCGTIDPESSSRASSYRPEDATLCPHILKLRLMRYEIGCELIPTERCALLSVQYDKQERPGFLFDIPGKTAPTVVEDKAHRTISFLSTENSGGVPDGFATYYLMKFSHAWADYSLSEGHSHNVGVMHFHDAVRDLEIRIATSFISFEQAERNLDLELKDTSPGTLFKESEDVWNSYLDRVVIQGATEAQQRTFYSCLYRTLLFPRIWHEPGPSGQMQHRSPYNGKIVAGVMYADHGYWDVYRAWYPLMTILFPERLGEILQAWVNAYKEGGWLPQFPCPGYRACMTGSLIDSIFGEAVVKGIKGFDMAIAYEGLKKHATQPGNPDAGYGRRGLPEYLRYGYAPAGMVDQSVAETVDAAYGDYCIAQVAKALGKTDDYQMFIKRSENWRNLFDSSSGFLRGKKADGSWLEPFDAITWGDPYVEGSAWQHRWDVPHDIHALIEAMGGKDKAVAALDQMLSMQPNFNTGSYATEIHEMSEMAAVNFGQYAHSNQPVHHILYVYTAAGRPDKAAFWAHKVMADLYTPDTYPGDEDTGSMAAWYILSSLGFFPLCPARPEYLLGAPLFPRATVKLAAGKTLVVEAAGGLTQSASLDGRRLHSFTIDHASLVNGGHLRFS